MTTWTRAIPWLGLMLIAGCGTPPKTIFATTGAGSGDGDSGDADADTDSDTDVDADTDTDTDTDTGDTGGEEGDVFRNPGDTKPFTPDSDGEIKVDLTDAEGGSNRDQQFYLVIVNTGEEEVGYTLRYIPTVDEEEEEEEDDSGAPPLAIPEIPTLAAASITTMVAPVSTPTSKSPPPPPSTETLDETDIGTARRVFHVRRELEDDTSCEVVDATLWAVGDSVAIWVDGDVPIDRYLDCDDLEGGGFEAAEYEAHGFDNCDLKTVAEIVDVNIVPNARSLLGDESDVNHDGLVSVVISPVLNAIALSSEDEDKWGNLIESYTDPETDLNEYTEDLNPCSDYQEVIYVIAPDPYGAYNAFSSVTVDEYTGMELAGQIALGVAKLITYNQKVFVNEVPDEEEWIHSGIGAVLADLTGFGAIFFDDAWDYMDAPHLETLFGKVSAMDEGDDVINTRTKGAQYLFFRWLVDAYGEDVLSDLVSSSATDTTNIENVCETGLGELVVSWQVALKTSGVLNASGDILMDTETWVPYDDAALVSAPTEAPSSGDRYGANGFQSGINVGGLNLYMDGGTDEVAVQVEANQVLLNYTDYFTYVAGVPFYGYLAADYGVQVVRLADIPYEEATVEVQASTSTVRGVVIRWTDAESVDFKVEDVFSATDANNMALPSLPEDGSPITGMGTISEPGVTIVINPGADSEAVDVYDTDRWLLDLTDRDATEDVNLAISVDRRYENLDGDIAPYDIWAGVVPSNLLPTPTVGGTTSGSCEDGESFAYPASLLDYLYFQMFLSAESGSNGVTAGFDPCGGAAHGDTADSGSTDPTCAVDWDGDGVLDRDEPHPSTLVEQVMVMQCTLAGGDIEDIEPVQAEDLIDSDSVDDDNDPYMDRTRNLGGRSGEEDEEAYLEVSLAGGATYTIVVGSGTDTGPYELRVRQLD